MLDYKQFEFLILNPALSALQLDNLSILVAGTIAHESKGGTYIKQLNGPALGIAQMEPATHDSIWQSYLPNQNILTHKLMTLLGFARAPKANQMINDMLYSVVMCACLYKWRLESHKENSPKTIIEAAQVWKKYYNSNQGKGTTDEFINDYGQWTGTGTKPGKPTKAMAA